tara:strand:+ start:385 stop:630 length:246 start_codon:yes stop_codon:yes gene_type:complete
MYLKTNKMKLVKEHSRLTQVKEGNRIVFKVLESRNGKRFHSMYKGGFGIVPDCNSFEECIEKTFKKLHIINEDFKNRLITL